MSTGDAFLETYRAHLTLLGVEPGDLRTDGNGTIRHKLMAPDPEDLPELVGFDVGDTLGQGAMGMVSSAWQLALDREVAVKGLRGGDIGETERQALVHEARITGQLAHPNVVPIHDLGLSTAGQPMFAMKRIDGRAWSDWLADPTEEQAARIVEAGGHLAFHVDVLVQVCNAVSYAHSRGVLHRDLKPANVMIGHFGEVYLVDWGIAARLEDLTEGDPHLVGTPAYMAPEMAAGRPLTEAADIYQLGAVLYELVAGVPPRPRATPMKTLALAWSGEILPLPDDCPPALAPIIRTALAKDPADRHASVAVLQGALRRWMRNQPLLELASAVKRRVAKALEGLENPTDPKPALREARDALAALDQLRQRLDDPGLDQARVDLLSALLQLEIQRERAGMAEALLLELGGDASEAQHTAVQQALADEAARARELVKLRDQGDWTYGRELRQRYVAFLGWFQALIYVPLGLYEVFVAGEPLVIPRTWLPGVGIPSLVALAALLMQRSGPEYDTLGARTQRALALTVVGANVLFLTCLALGLELRLCFFFTLTFALGLGLGLQGVYTRRSLYAPAALFAGTGLAVLLAPREATFFVLPVGVGLAHLAAWWSDQVD